MPYASIDPATAAPHVREMAKSDLILEMGVVQAMQHFHARHVDVRQALDIALVTRSKEDIARCRGKVAAMRMRRKVVGYERQYPMILRQLREGSYRKIGAHYGVTHAWVNKIARAFSRLAVLANMTEDQCMKSVEREARG